MSDSQAISTVTRAICYLLDGPADQAVPGASANPGPPNSSGGDGSSRSPEIRVFLYQATPNAAQRNADLPMRRQDGTLVERPTVALDLHYLLCFYGSEVVLQPQQLLAATLSTLHAQPSLTPEWIRRAAHDMVLGESEDHRRLTLNQAEQVQAVHLTQLPLSLEELSKLWSVFFQTDYVLSLAIQASVVLVQSDEMPQQALPVQARQVHLRQFRQPVIETIVGQLPDSARPWADDPIVVGGTLEIRGRQLRDEVTRVRINDAEIEPALVSDTRLRLPLTMPPLPSRALRAGVEALQVLHPVKMGTPARLHRGFESNLASFVLRPTFTSDDIDVVDISISDVQRKQLRVTLTPPVGKQQRVVLLLNELNAPAGREPYAYRMDAAQENGITDNDIQETDTVPFFLSDEQGVLLVQPATYLVRVQVDGAESPLEMEQGEYVEPKVTIP